MNYTNNVSMLLDLIVIVVLIVSIRKGMHKGLVMLISGIVSLFAGIFGGRVFAEALYKQTASKLFLPRVRDAITKAIAEIKFPQAGAAATEFTKTFSDAITKVAKDARLPAFSTESLYSFFKSATAPIVSTAQDFINASATVVAERIAYVLLFVIGFLAIEGIMFFALRIVNLIAKLPILNMVNRLIGALIGALSGVLFLMVLLWIVSVFVPGAKADGGFLSPSIINGTYLAKGIVNAYNKMIPLPYQSLSPKMIGDLISYATKLIKPM